MCCCLILIDRLIIINTSQLPNQNIRPHSTSFLLISIPNLHCKLKIVSLSLNLKVQKEIFEIVQLTILQSQDIICFIIQIMYFQKNSHYGKQTFWEKRYAENLSEFDWYQDWANLKDIISQFVKVKGKILNVGAGNSVLSQQMYKEGYKNIANIDFSEIVVDDMQTKYKKQGYDPSLTYQLADARNMKEVFEDETFDCVIDKGLLDSILCGAYSKQNSKKMLAQISRVLKNKGYYICVSYGDPDIRNHYFDNPFYKWARLPQCPYKIFKPNIDENEKNIVFSDKDKQKNKDYYHYIYIMEKGLQFLSAVQQKMKSSQAVNPK